MNNFNITKKDLEQIEAILRNNKNIQRLYDKLSELEVQRKKNTKEFKDLLNYISIVIEVEDKLYNEANLTPEKTLSWIKFLKRIKDKDNIIIRRILNNLFQKLTNNYNILINLPNKELSNVLKICGINLTDQNSKKEEVCKCILIKESIQKDSYHIFISFLQEETNNPKQKKFNEHLIKSKYEAIFQNKDIELFTLKNNFDLPNNPYIFSPIIKDIYNINPKLYTNIKDIIGSKIVSTQIYKILEIKDEEYNNINIVASQIIRQCMIKSYLTLMSDTKISDVNYELHELIEDKDYEELYPNHNISENIIINLFKSIKKDKEKIKILSIK